jgi:capsular polysaccharide biosynthesis protein
MFIAALMLLVGTSVAGMFLVNASLGTVATYLYFRAYEIACPESPGRRFLGWTLFVLPAAAFWSIFLGKDVLVFVGLACATYALTQVMVRGRWMYLPFLAAGLALVFFVRPPIVAGFTGAAVVAMALRPGRGRGSDAYLVPVKRAVMCIALGVVGYNVLTEGLLRVGVQTLTLEALAERAAGQQQGFASTEGGGQLSATISGADPLSVALSIPFGMLTVLFRPFVWEAHNALALVAGIENAFLIVLVAWRAKAIVRSLAAALRQPFWIFVALTFVSLTVAVSFQWNLGAAARLRTMGFPFLLLLAAGPGAAPAPAAATTARGSGHGLRGFREYGRIAWSARWALLAAGAVAGLTAFWVTLGIPKVYAAKATVTAPRSPAGVLTGGAVGINAAVESLAAATSDLDLFRVVLKSRRVNEEVMAEFEKMRGAEARSKVIRVVPEDFAREVKGAFVITGEGRDPQLAADVTNSYVHGLNRLLRQYGEQRTEQRRAVYVAQFERAKREIARAEAALLEFRDKHRRLVAFDADPGGAARAGARAMIEGLELRREMLRMHFTAAAPEMRELEKEIAEAKRQYSKMLFGHAMRLPPLDGERGPRSEFFVPGAQVAPVDFAFRKLQLNLQIQESFYLGALEALQGMAYGQATVLGKVEILDPAVAPTTHIFPELGRNVLGAVTGTLTGGVLVLLFLDWIALLRRQDAERMAAR